MCRLGCDLMAEAEPRHDRRSTHRQQHVVYEANTARLVVSLPHHRLQPGGTVSYIGWDEQPRVVTVPADAQPGAAVRLATGESYGWPVRVELVLLPAFWS